MDPLVQSGIKSLMEISSGRPDLIIGVIDGPVDLEHNALTHSKIKTVKNSHAAACSNANSQACRHGTFVVGMLNAKRGSKAPAICPSCEVRLYPLFPERNSQTHNRPNIAPTASPQELSNAIVETVKSGAKIINLSLGIYNPSANSNRELQEAYEYALKNGSIIIIAAGNEGNIGYGSTLDFPWLIPVTGCNQIGLPIPGSHLSRSVGKFGLMAPGLDIISTMAGGQYIKMSGTSVAAPFVTGTLALLWSLFPELEAASIINSLRSPLNRRSVVPPLLNANLINRALNVFYDTSSSR